MSTGKLAKQLLMIALDFPPCLSAGVQRTLKFCEYLPAHGWSPQVITAKSMIYEKTDAQEHLSDTLRGNTHRAWGLNSVRHLGIGGKHFRFTALPDRYITWYWHASRLAVRVAEKQAVSAIWSTFPCSTAHKIGVYVKKQTGLPWIADFRDPFAGHHVKPAMRNKPAELIDRQVVESADRLVFTTSKTADLYRKVYNLENDNRIVVIENGYNEEVFALCEEIPLAVNHEASKYTILHSGGLYEGGRDPETLFDALASLKQQGTINGSTLEVRFRGIADPGRYEALVKHYAIDDIVTFLPILPYRESIQEMLAVNALLLIQGKMFRNQVPGKLYEYLRARKPVLALTSEQSATSDTLADVAHAVVADMENKSLIEAAITQLFGVNVDPDFACERYSRQHKTAQLADLLEGF